VDHLDEVTGALRAAMEIALFSGTFVYLLSIPVDRFAVIGDGQSCLFGIVNVPENDCINIHRNRVLGECLLGIEGGGLDPAVDDRDDAITTAAATKTGATYTWFQKTIPAPAAMHAKAKNPVIGFMVGTLMEPKLIF
jgi:hypothetical protein